MFTTNLSIIIITGTGAGHEPQNKSPRPEELSSTVLWLGLNTTNNIGRSSNNSRRRNSPPPTTSSHHHLPPLPHPVVRCFFFLIINSFFFCTPPADKSRQIYLPPVSLKIYCYHLSYLAYNGWLVYHVCRDHHPLPDVFFFISWVLPQKQFDGLDLKLKLTSSSSSSSSCSSTIIVIFEHHLSCYE